MNDSHLRQKSPIREWRPLPSDRVIYRDLPSHAVDWAMLEDDLGNRGGFSGVVEVVTRDRLGRVYYLESQAAGSHILRPEGLHRALGKGIVAELLGKPEARLSVYGLDPAVARLSIAAPSWEVLRAAQATPARLLEWLDELELNAHTGELELTTDRGTGSVLFENGIKVLISFSAPDTGPVFGLGALNMHKVAARWPEAMLIVTGRDMSSGASVNSKLSAPAASGAPELVVTQVPVTLSTPSAAPPVEIIAAWREVLEFTEYRTDSARGKGSFDLAWREVCLGLADRYPQLDPFLEDLRYAAGKLTVTRPNRASFEALGTAYIRVLTRLNVPTAAVGTLLVPIRDKYCSVWHEAQLEGVCPL